jgi:hypothetical protein
VNIALTLHGPGLGWLPRSVRSRAYWALVARFALIGPFVGGLPYVWIVISLPFMFVIGLVPALITGMLYAAWWVAPGMRRPTPLWRAAVGAICGAVGCAVVAAGYSPGSAGLPFLVLAAHGVPAAIALALATGTAKNRLAGKGAQAANQVHIQA